MKLKIGLEIHIQIDTKTKLFSSSKNLVDKKINSYINNIDIGAPGALPVLNKKAVQLGIRLALLLNSEITDKLFFDRKNYFYHDLPKGFQITQFNKPLASKGFFDFVLKNNKFKRINIKHIILEEDTANSKIIDGNLFIDFNRSGIGLIELVTEPDFSSSYEVKCFLDSIFLTLKNAKISKCIFSSGNIRVDINISVFTVDGKKTNRVEIKNLNKFENIIKAIEQEFLIQKEFLNKNKENKIVTKKFDEKLQKIILMRKKMTEENYFFIPETNILPIDLSNNLILQEKDFIKNNKFLLEKDFIKTFKLDFETSKILLKNNNIFNIFKNIYFINNISKEKLINYLKNISFLFVKKCLNENIILEILKKNLNIKEMINITKKYLKDQFFNIDEYFENINYFKKIYSKKNIESFCMYLINTDNKLLNKYKLNKEPTKKYIMGEIMKWSYRKANPSLTLKIIEKIFNNFVK